MWTGKSLLLFSIASALGAFSRAGIGVICTLLGGEALAPVGTFIANVLGCFFFGVFWIYCQHKKLDTRIILVGFMGSFTTFSTYIFDMYTYALEHSWGQVIGYGFGQIALALTLLHMGMRISEHYFVQIKK